MVSLIVYYRGNGCAYAHKLLAVHLLAIILQRHLGLDTHAVGGKRAAVAYACTVVNLMLSAIEWVESVEVICIRLAILANGVVEWSHTTTDIEVIVNIYTPTAHLEVEFATDRQSPPLLGLAVTLGRDKAAQTDIEVKEGVELYTYIRVEHKVVNHIALEGRFIGKVLHREGDTCVAYLGKNATT